MLALHVRGKVTQTKPSPTSVDGDQSQSIFSLACPTAYLSSELLGQYPMVTAPSPVSPHADPVAG